MYEGTWKPNRRKVVTTAPDMVVFLNGEPVLPSGASPYRNINIQPLVTSVSTSLDKDNPPGTANISLSIPRHYKDDFFRGGRLILTFGMEVQIYMRGHFVVGGAPRYYPVFWGLVTSVGEEWSGGEQTVSLSCQDILWWWQNQQMNINPAYTFAQQVDTSKFNLTGNFFTGMNPFNIIYTLSRQVYGDSLNANLYFDEMRSEATEEERLRMAAYWTQKWGRITQSLKMYGVNGEVIQGDLLSRAKKTNVQYMDGKKSAAASLEGDKWTPFKFGDINLLRTSPFPWSPGSAQFDLYSSEFMTKLQIAQTTSEAIGYEFFMDSTGEIIFKPPFYNLDVRPNRPVSWIREIDVISQSFSENPPEFTYLEGEGSFVANMEVSADEVAIPRAVYVDYELVKKYGWRPGNFSSEFLGAKQGGGGPKSMFFHLISKMDEEASTIYEGSVTIPLRPELRLGYPVFIPHKDAYFYVRSISHNFTWGGQCTSQITLGARRSKFYAPFDDWEEKQPPSTGSTADPDRMVVNLGFRPVDPETGQPVGDENVVLGPVKDTQTQRKKDDELDTYAKEGKDLEVEKRRLTSLRSQYGLEAEYRNYVYTIPTQEVTHLLAGDIEVQDSDGRKRMVNAGIFPISDSRGYEVVGVYEYGRGARVSEGAIATDGPQSDADRLVFMRPESPGPENQVPESDPDREGMVATNTHRTDKQSGPQVHPNNYGRRLAELKPPNTDVDLIATARGLVAGLAPDPEQRVSTASRSGGGSIGAVDTAIKRFGRTINYKESVAKWYPVIQRVRQRLEAEGVQIPDSMTDDWVLAFFHVESDGDVGNTSGSYWGIGQIGDKNASDFDKTKEEFIPRSAGGTAPDEETAVERSTEQLFRYLSRYRGHHGGNTKAMVITWHQGPGRARQYREGVVEGEETEDQFLSRVIRGENIEKYWAWMDAGRSIYSSALEKGKAPQSEGEAQTAAQQAVSAAQAAAEEAIADDETTFPTRGELERALSEQQAHLLDNLAQRLKPEEGVTSLPSNLPIPRDPATIDRVNTFLAELYQRAFEDGRSEEAELRGETRRRLMAPDPASVPTQRQQTQDRPMPSLLDRPEVQRHLEEGGSVEDLFVPGGIVDGLDAATERLARKLAQNDRD